MCPADIASRDENFVAVSAQRRGLPLIVEPHPLLSRVGAGMALIVRWFSFGATLSTPSNRLIVAAREPRRNGDNPGAGAAVITRTRTQTKRPNMYRVLFHDYDYTYPKFVVSILSAFFN